MMERTLVLVKPDGVERGLVGECIDRFEKRGLKIVGLKMVWTDKDHAMKHYTEDISKRRGEKVREKLLEFITSGPVVAIAIEGVNSIENVRKIVGSTEPREATPGTIRGDFAHVSYTYADDKNIVVKNLIHASSDSSDAKHEINLWFNDNEMHSYSGVHDKHINE
jgi:nucleoside-diphosphate kinase|tara:strand:+ start:4157 stop:4651 length:495 start_codon:yes stop_codon:yes gene_type:complete